VGGVAGGLGGFGGVLGEIAGHHGVGDLTVAADSDDADVGLFAPADAPPVRPGGMGFGGEGDGGGGVFDRVDQVDDAEPVRGPDGAGLVGVGGVEADDGMEVGHATALQLGDLAVGDPDR